MVVTCICTQGMVSEVEEEEICRRVIKQGKRMLQRLGRLIKSVKC